MSEAAVCIAIDITSVLRALRLEVEADVLDRAGEDAGPELDVRNARASVSVLNFLNLALPSQLA